MTSSTKRTLILLAIVLVLGGIQALVNWRSSAPRELPANPLATVVVQDVTSVTLTRGEQTLDLLKADGTWRVSGIDDLADVRRITTLLEDLTGARVTRVASYTGADAATLAPFYLDAPQALRVVLKSGDGVLAQVSVGSKDSQSSYVLADGSPIILELDRGVLASPLADSWRSRSVSALDVSAVTEVELRGRTAFTLRKDGAVYQLLQDGKTTEVPTDKATAYLTTIANLPASGFLTAEEATGLDAPALTLLVRSATGPEFELKVGEKTELGDLAVKTNQRKAYFTVTALDVEGIEQPDLEPEPPAVAPSAAPVSAA